MVETLGQNSADADAAPAADGQPFHLPGSKS